MVLWGVHDAPCALAWTQLCVPCVPELEKGTHGSWLPITGYRCPTVPSVLFVHRVVNRPAAYLQPGAAPLSGLHPQGEEYEEAGGALCGLRVWPVGNLRPARRTRNFKQVKGTSSTAIGLKSRTQQDGGAVHRARCCASHNHSALEVWSVELLFA